MFNTPSLVDLIARRVKDIEEASIKDIQSMPDNYIMVYMIQVDCLRMFCDEYPEFRSFLITRTLARRLFFIKLSEIIK